MRYSPFVSIAALVVATMLSGCLGGEKSAENAEGSNTGGSVAHVTVPSGSSIDITLSTGLSSEHASVGDAWTGSVVNGLAGIPAGSTVSGTVSAVKPAVKGDRAMLDLKLASITVNGRNYPMSGGMEAVVAGSTRARNLGAIAGSAAGGALIGKAVSGTTKGAVVGGVIGGGVATGVVAASDGYQVELKPGTPLTFTTSGAVAVRS
jgi:hypothetical protein